MADEYHHYEYDIHELRREIAECQSQYFGLAEHVIRLGQKRYYRGRTSI